MKNLIKKHSKVVLCAGVLLFSCKVFSASEASKQLIHETLAKYGISAGGKEVCGTAREPDYNNGNVKCKNDSPGDINNCWDPDSRLCKTCPYGTIVNRKNYKTCIKIICPEGWELAEVKKGEYPDWSEFQELEGSHSCNGDWDIYTEATATNNYSTDLINCKNLN